jgi:hypothetical protein
MTARRTPSAGRIRPAKAAKRANAPTARTGKKRPPGAPPAEDLTARAQAGDAEAFLALVRFHSTFDPLPVNRDILVASGLDSATRERLLGRLKRKEDRLLRPFPGVSMVFWEETWVQETLDRFLWRKRGGKRIPDETFVRKLWDATREGAMLQLDIYKRAHVTPSAWVRVKSPHFTDLGLSEDQMLKIARAEGCRFDEEAFRRAVRRFRGKAGS